MSKGIRLAGRSLTLYHRRDVHFTNKAEELRAAESAKKFLADSFSWRHDSSLMAQLQKLLGLSETDEGNARWKVQRAFETGELVTMPDAPSSGLNGSRGGNDAPLPRSFTVTPSQLFKGAPSMASCVREYVPRKLPRLPADDFFEIMAAKPGDVLPDGSIAKPFTPKVMDDSELEALRQRVFGNADVRGGGSLLSDAQPFEYQPDAVSDDAFELAGTSRGDMYACDIISSECKGSVLREFPRQYLDSTYNDIQGDARDGVKDARKALKLLNDNRFKK